MSPSGFVCEYVTGRQLWGHSNRVHTVLVQGTLIGAFALKSLSSGLTVLKLHRFAYSGPFAWYLKETICRVTEPTFCRQNEILSPQSIILKADKAQNHSIQSSNTHHWVLFLTSELYVYKSTASLLTVLNHKTAAHCEYMAESFIFMIAWHQYYTNGVAKNDTSTAIVANWSWLSLQGLTTVLFPLTVVKTRQQAIEGTPGGISGAVQIAKDVVARDGVRGLYRGFGTVIVGIIPARGVSLWSK